MKFDTAVVRSALLAWHRRHGLAAPWRDSGDPYQVLVAAVMAQQTQMSRVVPKYDEFMTVFPTVGALAEASTAAVLRAWAPLGYNMRALRLHKAARRIANEGWPKSACELEQIDGVGPCTAAIVASFSFGEAVAAIDVNVVRILARLWGDVGGAMGERDVRPLAERLVSKRTPGRWNQALMDLGALVCTARAPKCNVCPMARWCGARVMFDLTPSRFPFASLEGRPKGKGNRQQLTRVSEERTSYKTRGQFAGSRRYYRGRIVQALRELAPGESMTTRRLLGRMQVAGRAPQRQAKACPTERADGLDAVGLRALLASLQRDGLVRVERGRVRLP